MYGTQKYHKSKCSEHNKFADSGTCCFSISATEHDHFQAINEPYAFIEFTDHNSALQALTAMNRRVLMGKVMNFHCRHLLTLFSN